MQLITPPRTSGRLPYMCIMCIILCLTASCKRQDALPLPASVAHQDDISLQEGAAAAHKWYSFIDGDIRAINLPRLSPPQGKRPWTEAVRVASMCGTDSGGMGEAVAYALVNRLGIIEMDGGDMTLHQDASVFASRTVGPLSFGHDNDHDVPIFSVYRNTLFNEKAGEADVLHQFLVQFEPVTHIFYPILSCGNLGLGDQSEVVDYVWDGTDFICSVKTIINEGNVLGGSKNDKPRTDFTYLSIDAKAPLTSITPQDKEAVSVSAVTKETYRRMRMTVPFAAAPKRLRALLGFLEGRVSFIITCCTVGAHCPRGFVSESGGALLNAYAILGDTYICAMFADGTTYLSGSLPNVPIKDIAAFRLPLLPDGWAYTSFAITGQYLYAAWEETDFYETGRSGLIRVDLSKALGGIN